MPSTPDPADHARTAMTQSGTPVPDAGPEGGKKVTPLELFFDLVFVYAVTRASELLQEDHSWAGALRALVAFVPVFWTWAGTTIHANLHEVDTLRGRLEVFVVGACGLVMAVALPEAYGEKGLLFAGGYWAARLVMWGSVQKLPHRHGFVSFTVGAFVTGLLMVLGALLPEHLRMLVWALAGLVDLGVPYLVRSRLQDLPLDAGHLAERYSTFVIIALGETVVSTGAALEHVSTMGLLALAASFAVCCGLWWVYFDLAAGAIEDALQASERKIEILRSVLSYGHLCLVAGIIGVAAAIGTATGEPLEHLHRDVAALLFGGTALYLATFGFTRWMLFRSVAVPRLCGALACLLLVLLAPHVAALWALLALVAVLVAVNVADHVRATPRVPEQPVR